MLLTLKMFVCTRTFMKQFKLYIKTQSLLVYFLFVWVLFVLFTCLCSYHSALIGCLYEWMSDVLDTVAAQIGVILLILTVLQRGIAQYRRWLPGLLCCCASAPSPLPKRHLVRIFLTKDQHLYGSCIGRQILATEPPGKLLVFHRCSMFYS